MTFAPAGDADVRWLYCGLFQSIIGLGIKIEPAVPAGFYCHFESGGKKNENTLYFSGCVIPVGPAGCGMQCAPIDCK